MPAVLDVVTSRNTVLHRYQGRERPQIECGFTGLLRITQGILHHVATFCTPIRVTSKIALLTGLFSEIG